MMTHLLPESVNDPEEKQRATHQVAGLVVLVVRSDGQILTECKTHLCDLLPGQQLELF